MHNNYKSKLITLIWNTSLSYRLKRRLLLLLNTSEEKAFGYGNLIYCRSYVEYLFLSLNIQIRSILFMTTTMHHLQSETSLTFNAGKIPLS